MKEKQMSLDQRLDSIRKDPSGRDFILVDAKDPTDTWGVSSTGVKSHQPDCGSMAKTRQEFYEDIRRLVKQEVLDVVLASLQSMDILGRQEGLFWDSPVTPAVRINQSTDIWSPRGGVYNAFPSRPFSASSITHAMYGRARPLRDQKPHVKLGLYSITFNNDVEFDLASLEAYKAFRLEAEQEGLRHILEVFRPNVGDCGLSPEELPGFINDHILRTLSGISSIQQPIFLKIEYLGPRAMEELSGHDSNLIVGILGGSSGTTHDAFKLIADAQKYGAKAATFGRKIKNAEDPLIFVAMLRRIVEGEFDSEEAVRAYHGELRKIGIAPFRDLEEDLQLTNPMLKR
jgi:hypothetical protein